MEVKQQMRLYNTVVEILRLQQILHTFAYPITVEYNACVGCSEVDSNTSRAR